MYEFSSIQEHSDSGGRRRNVVVIKNGKGYKEHATLSPAGQVIRKSRHTLKRGELKAIANRQFVPTLWKCCRPRKSTRKQRRA